MKKLILVVNALILCAIAFGQIQLTNSTPSITENFNSMSTGTSLPVNWGMAASTSSPTWAGGTRTLTQQASSGSPATGGTYNWGSTSSERAAGAMTSGSFASPNNLMGYFQNKGTTSITKLTVGYKGERYRVNSANASIQFFYSVNGTSWTAITAGDIATSSFPTGASSYTIASPLTITKTGIDINVTLAANAVIYLRWNINTTGSNSQGIGVDDVTVTATFQTPCNAPASIAKNNITSSGADISWSSVSGAVGYQYQISQSSTPGTGTDTTGTTYTASGLSASTKYYIHVRTDCSGTYSSWIKDSFVTAVSTAPTIQLSTTSLAIGNVVKDSVSSVFTYQLSAVNLTQDVVITAINGTQVSLNSATGYSPSITLTQQTGTIDTTIVYVKYFCTSDSGSYTQPITHTSLGADTVTVTVTLNRISVEPNASNQVVVVSKTQTTVQLAVNGTSGLKRLIVARASSSVNFQPTDATIYTSGVSLVFTSAVDQGSGNKIMYNGTEDTITVNGLSAGITYYFSVFEFNEGVGNSQNYTAAVSVNVTTLDAAIMISNADGQSYVETFNAMGNLSMASLPTGFQISAATTTPVFGTSVTTATTQAFGTTGTGVVTSSSGGGIVNWASGVNASSTDRAVGFLGSSGYAGPRSLMVKIYNASATTITSMLVDFDIEKYRSGSRAMNVKFYSSVNGSTWILLQTKAFSADANNTQVFNPADTYEQSVMISPLLFEADSYCYLRWEFEPVGGSTNSQGVAVDNISLSAFSNTIVDADTLLNQLSYSNLNVIDHAKLSSNITVSGRTHFESGSTLKLNGYKLILNGDISGEPTLIGDTSAQLEIAGSGLMNAFSFNQDEDGITNTLKSLLLDRSGAQLTLNNKLAMVDEVNLSAGTLNTGGNLNLLSSSTHTASISEIKAGASITGNVTVQRFIPAVTRRSRMLSSALSSFSFAQLKDDIYISGIGGVTNGFDSSSVNGHTAYTYQESTDGSGRGWKGIATINETLSVGQGALVFIRGDRTLTAPAWYTSPYPAQNQVVLDYDNAPVNAGTITLPLSYTNTGVVSDDGWNLVGNPYPSAVSWSLLTKQGLSSFYYIYNPQSGSYVADDGTTNIASGQAFFVQAIAPTPSIQFEESNKVKSNIQQHFKKAAFEELRIEIKKDSLNSDLAILRFNNHATKGYSHTEDALKFTNATINFSFVDLDNKLLQINTQPNPQVADSFKIFIEASSGNYTLNFKELPSYFTSGLQLMLVDYYANISANVSPFMQYNFTVNANANSKGNRFVLVTATNAPLPVKLLQYAAQNKGELVKVSWVTTNEINMKQYEIEYSENGIDFRQIGVVKATGNSNKKEYDFLHPNSHLPNQYFRIGMREVSGTITYSTVMVLSELLQTNAHSLFPNPTVAGETIYFKTTDAILNWSITNSLGEIVQHTASYQTNASVNRFEISGLKPGIYYLLVSTNKEVISAPIWVK